MEALNPRTLTLGILALAASAVLLATPSLFRNTNTEAAALQARLAEQEARIAELEAWQQAYDASRSDREQRRAERVQRLSERRDRYARDYPTEFEISAEQAAELQDADLLSRMGRALPHRSYDGDIDGYRVSGIRRESVPAKLGVRNGDIVHRVNGLDITSIEQAMAAYQAVKSADAVDLDVTRRGQKLTLHYTWAKHDER